MRCFCMCSYVPYINMNHDNKDLKNMVLEAVQVKKFQLTLSECRCLFYSWCYGYLLINVKNSSVYSK